MKGDFNFKVIITITLILLPIVAMSACAENINRSIAPMPKEGTITGNIKMITKINDYCLGQPNMMFLTRTLTSENYTIYVTGNNVTYFTKPDANGDFSINVLYGTYNIWVLVDGPYDISYPGLAEPGRAYSYPDKSDPIRINITKDHPVRYVNITFSSTFYSPTPALMPDARGRIYGYIDFPKKDMENLSVEDLILKVYLLFILFNAPRYSVSISPMKNGTFSFDNLYLGSGPYRIEVIPSKISVDDNIIAVYEPLNITFDYYATPKHVILERRIDLNYKIISKNGTLDFQNAFKELSS